MFAAAILSRCCCGISLRQIRCAIVIVVMVVITGITSIARIINIVQLSKIEIWGKFFASNRWAVVMVGRTGSV